MVSLCPFTSEFYPEPYSRDCFIHPWLLDRYWMIQNGNLFLPLLETLCHFNWSFALIIHVYATIYNWRSWRIWSLWLVMSNFSLSSVPVHTSMVRSTMIYPGSLGFQILQETCAYENFKAQKKRLNITDVQYFHRLWSCLRTHKQVWGQLCLIVYLLFILLLHNLRQLPFSPPLPLHYAPPPPRSGQA